MVRSFLFFLFVCLSFNTSSQERRSNPLDEGFIPPKNSMLGSEHLKDGRGNGPMMPNKHSLKFCAGDISRFNLHGIYEFNIFPQLSITLGMGKPVGKDWLFWFSQYVMWDEEKGIVSQETDLPYLNLIQQSVFKSGKLFSGTLRYYIHKSWVDKLTFIEIGVDNVRRDFFFQSELHDRDWKSGVEYLNERMYVTPFGGEKTQATGVFFNYGTQWNSKKGTIKFSHEFSWSLGVRFLKYDAFEYQTIIISNKQIDRYQTNGLRVQDVIPFLGFSYNIGIGYRNS